MKRLQRHLVLIAAALLVATAARSEVLFEETFEGAATAVSAGVLVDTATGTGWRSGIVGDDRGNADYLQVPVAGRFLPVAGTIELDLIRDNRTNVEALFAFADAQGRTLKVAQIFWGGVSQSRYPELKFEGTSAARLWYSDLSSSQYGQVEHIVETVPFDRNIAPGGRFHLAFTWGPAGDDCKILLNGVELAAAVDIPFGFSDLVSRATTFVIGGEPARAGSGGFSHISSVVDSVRVYDGPLGADALAQNVGPLVEDVAADQALYGAGQTITVTLRGTQDLAAAFTVTGVATDVALTEVDDGVYVGSVAVPADAVDGVYPLTATLGGSAANGGSISIDTTHPEAIATGRILDPIVGPGEIELSWAASASADVASYRVYRAEGSAPSTTGNPISKTRELSFIDTAVLAGIEYFYTVVAVDAAGNASGPSDIVSATAEAGDGPAVSSIAIEPFGRPLKPGETVTLTLTGLSGADATVDLSTLAAGLTLTEAGSTGTYTAAYTIPPSAVGPTATTHRVVVTLTDAYGQTTQAGPELTVIGEDALNDTTAPVIADAGHDAWQTAGFSGKLVPGDLLTVTLTGEAGGSASFTIDGVTTGVTLEEQDPGTYSGTYTVDWDDEGTETPVTATLSDAAGNTTSVSAGQPVTFDTRVRLTVTSRDALLPADGESRTRLVIQAEDANGSAVAGHDLSLTLTTTEQYTGVVGGGDLEGQSATKDDAEDLEVKWDGTTDNFGEVAATYTAGFAAKTALIVVKDLTTGDVGAGWLGTYIASTVAIELTPTARAARGQTDRAVLTLTADPSKLTADGRSRSRLTARLTDFSNNPIADARIAFTLAGDNGRLKTLDSRTDASGEAQAEYRAGTAIGSVTITAASTDYAVTAARTITLTSDAPAELLLASSETSLPADGSSESTISLRVTDIHGNPNDQVPVTLAILQGGGNLSTETLSTDNNGEGSLTYTAGRDAGQAVIEARHTSRAPSQDELRRIQGTVFVPKLMERQERERIKIDEWLIEPGDEVTKGQPLLTLASRKATWTITAPETGIFIREVKHRKDRVELGDTLGYVEVDVEVWEATYRE